MMTWMLYAVGVAGLLTGAAAITDRALKGAAGMRWVWGAALASSALLPLAMGWAAPRSGAAAGPLAGTAGGPGGAVPGVPAWPGGVGTVTVLEPFLVPAWVLSSGLLLLILAAGVGVLHRRARRWPRVRLPQGEVLLSERFGPALIGGIRSRVVLPRWSLHLGRRALWMILVHEEEHRRTGDVPVLLAGALAVVVLPWNPFLWYQLRRLRAAVEMDCDRRVLRRGVPAAEYGRLLLDLAARPGGGPLPWTALAGHTSLLERRLMMIVRSRRRVNRTALAGAGLLAAGLVFLACETDAPPLAPDNGADAQAAQAEFEAQKSTVSPVAGGGPLIFVDGEPVTKAALEGMDPARIDRIEVVKGSAAEVVFGPEGAGGVIQIFTQPVGEGEPAGTTTRRDGDAASAERLPPPPPVAGILEKRKPR